MIDIYGDLWDLPAQWRCLTTNGFVKNDGRAVMGRGCAQQARDMFSGIDFVLGNSIKHNGNHVAYLGKYAGVYTFSFPVKHRWDQVADLELIDRSCTELLQFWFVAKKPQRMPMVILPRPGAGNGKRDYETEVRPILESHFGAHLPYHDRFQIVTWPEG